MDAAEMKSLPLFDGLSDEVLEQCAARFSETEMPAGSVLAREGDFAYKFFAVLDGRVAVERDSEHVADLGPGEFFGEMGVLEHVRRNARVVAVTRCRLAWMTAWDFESMTCDHPDVAARIASTAHARSKGSSDG